MRTAIYRATRSSVDEPFGLPSRVEAARGFVEGATLSPDGRALCYHALDGDRYALYRITR